MSDTDQDYKILKTPEKGHEVKVRTYTTGADEEAITEVITSSTKTRVEGEGKDAKTFTDVDATLAGRLKRLKVERFVVSVDGKEEGHTQAVFDMRSKDHKHVVDFVEDLTKNLGGLGTQEKKD